MMQPQADLLFVQSLGAQVVRVTVTIDNVPYNIGNPLNPQVNIGDPLLAAITRGH